MTAEDAGDPVSRAWCVARDAEDPLRALRDRFDLGDGIYLDGNSLGPLPRTVVARASEMLATQWGVGRIGSWLAAGWMDSPTRVGDRVGRLLGAAPGQVVVADSTTINLHKLLIGALGADKARRVVLTERENFHTDLYAAAGAAGLAGGEVRVLPRQQLLTGLDEGVAVLLLTHVDFRSGEMHTMRRVTAAAHDAGALVLWDLSHSVGAVPLHLDRDEADLAVGCTYKYLNAGPGAPAFLYVAERHQATLPPGLPGWLGHAQPFEFDPGFVAAPGVRRFLSGTPPVLAIAVLDAALDAFDGVEMDDLRRRSVELTELFISLIDTRCAGRGLNVVTPRHADARGSHVALRHAQGYGVVQALIRRGVVGDFRAPDLCRFGFAPLYTTRAEIWDAVEAIRAVIDDGEFRDPAHAVRASVT